MYRLTSQHLLRNEVAELPQDVAADAHGRLVCAGRLERREKSFRRVRLIRLFSGGGGGRFMD